MALSKEYAIWGPAVLVLLLGGLGLLGWILHFPFLTHINLDWKPMVPATALGFTLSGLALLTCRGKAASRWGGPLLIGLIALLAGARGVEVLLEHFLQIEFTSPLWSWWYRNNGEMSPHTVLGFLIFAVGISQFRPKRSAQWTPSAPPPVSPWKHRWMRLPAGILMTFSVLTLFSYGIKLPYLFEVEFLRTGLIWMSLPTTIGMLLLGIGLWGMGNREKRATRPTGHEHRARQIYRATVLVVALTSLATGMAGISFLEGAILDQSKADMTQTIETKQAHLGSLIEDHIQRALLASTDPSLKAAATDLLENIKNKVPATAKTQITERLMQHGFSGVGLETGHQRKVIVGQLQPDSARSLPLKDEHNVSLIWDQGYYLRVRIPVGGAIPGIPAGFLIIEQALPRVSQLINEANNWGETGTLPMCGRINPGQLLCFPQREQPNLYVIPDNFKGKPIPMAFALAGERSVEIKTDYRGRHVLAAFGPVGQTGLGLVLKMDLSEVYTPVKQELLFLLPFIAILTLLGLGLIHLRIRPLLEDLTRTHTAEKAARSRFEAAMESSPDVFIIYEGVLDEAGEIVDFRASYANKNAKTITQLSDEGLAGHSCLELFPEQKGLIEGYRTVLRTGEPLINECTWMDDKGLMHWYLRQVVAMPTGVATTFRDITQEKRLFQELEYSNQLRTAIVESAAYSIISTDTQGTILSFNQAAERMLWYRADEMIGKCTPGVFHDPEEVKERADSLSQELGRLVEPGFEVFVAKPTVQAVEEREWTYIRKDGSRFPVRLSITALRGPKNEINGFLGIAYDISEQKRADEYIRHIALHDVLTGLPNRALLNDRVTVAIEQQRRNNAPLALAMMDIDRFKLINDSMGHHIGDQVLNEFVERVQSCLRLTDTLARMGGDEFVLLLPDTDEAGVEMVASRIKKALIPPIDVGLQEIHVSSSIGISISPTDGREINELLRCADVAMYWVKEHGRNGHKLFSREMDQGASERLNLERDLHHALEHNEFDLFYQPKVDLKSHTIVGVEALLRLRKSNGQHVSPANFIPLAEETGLIVPIGQWVMATACRDAVTLHQKLGTKLRMAINISPRQFVNDDLVLQIQTALNEANFSSHLLELEITEGVLMDDRSGVEATLLGLRDLGVKISIDDFGTGYSSLSYLKRYPIRQLKIDQSFIHDVTCDPEDAALIQAIIAMGHSLKIPVIAEGIETAEQMAFLTKIGCDQGQGYFIGRPMPLDTLLTWFGKVDHWRLDTAARIA